MPLQGNPPSLLSRDAALDRELEQLKCINESIIKAIGAVGAAKDNTARLKNASNVSHGLLDQWANILSQASFTRQVLDEPSWFGGADNSLLQSGLSLAEKLEREQDLLRELQLLESKNAITRQDLNRRLDKRSVTLDTAQVSKRRLVLRAPMPATNSRIGRK